MEDLNAKLEEFQALFARVQADLDTLSNEQRELLRAALARIEEQQIAAIRSSIGLS